MTSRVLESKLDNSINFVTPAEAGFFESRYVYRPDSDHITCYLSTQSGCRQGCRMCHLTTTKQTDALDASAGEIFEQAGRVFTHYEKVRPQVKAVHFSFMARGEPLASSVFLARGDGILDHLAKTAWLLRLLPRFCVSTILPNSVESLVLSGIFPITQPNIYYSIYSMNETFRKKWLPNAMPAKAALEKLKEYQDDTGRIVRLHWALIEGENDSIENAREIAGACNQVGLRVDVNLVRYNPPELEGRGKEASDRAYEMTALALRAWWPSAKVKVVQRVGMDVFASCGMFVGKEA